MEDAGFVGCKNGKLNWSVWEGPGVVRLGGFAWRDWMRLACCLSAVKLFADDG